MMLPAVARLIIWLAAGSTAGCGTVRIDALGIKNPTCAEAPSAELAAYLNHAKQALAAGAASHSLFAGPIPTAAQAMATEAAYRHADLRGSSPPQASKAAHDSAILLRAKLREIVPQVYATIDDAPRLSNTEETRTVLKIDRDVGLSPVLSQMLQVGGDEALVIELKNERDDLVASNAPSTQVRLKEGELRVGRFVAAYFKHYFRNWKIVDISLSASDLASEVIASLRKANPSISDAAANAAKSAVLQSLQSICTVAGGCPHLPSLGTDSLVTRDGQKMAFAGVSLAVSYDTKLEATWSYPKSAEFAPQLVRVAIEAIFDAGTGHPPGLDGSTACVWNLFSNTGAVPECLSSNVTSTIPGLADAVGDVDELASRADSLATTTAGAVIRGGYIVAINNEAISTSVENLVGVLAKKMTEYAGWRKTVDMGCRIGSSPLLGLGVSRD